MELRTEAQDDYQVDVAITRHVAGGGMMTQGYLEDGFVMGDDHTSDDGEWSGSDEEEVDDFVVPDDEDADEDEDEEEEVDDEEDEHEYPEGVYDYSLQDDNLYHCVVKHCGGEYIVVYSDWYMDCLSSSRKHTPEHLECEEEWRSHSIGHLTDITLPTEQAHQGDEIKGTFVERRGEEAPQSPTTMVFYLGK